MEHENPKKPDRLPVLLHVPVNIRSVALAVVAVFATIYALHWAAAVFIPLMISLLLTYALSPPVEWLARWRVPRWLTAAALLLGLLGGFGWTGYALSDDTAALIDSLPLAAQKVRDAVHTRTSTKATPLETVQKAAAQLEQAAQESGAQPPAVAADKGVMRVQVEPPHFNVRNFILSGTLGLLFGLGQATVVVFLTFFALASGDTFRRKLVKIAGPTLSEKKVTVQVLDEITEQIKRYLMVQVLSSVVVGVVTWLAFWLLGLEHSVVWGIAAGVFNLIPYVGSIAVTGGSALVAFLQFGTPQMALAVGGASLFIHTLTGNLLTPWLTSRTSRMNPVVVFVAVLFWGWLWGVWGLLLGIPILMVIKAICDRVEDLKPIGELLGD
ncbi:MAG: AI-2E family transporter [Burkholderiales bacterium]|nr:AI-2E family transporter [Burkholderiales bacterium]